MFPTAIGSAIMVRGMAPIFRRQSTELLNPTVGIRVGYI